MHRRPAHLERGAPQLFLDDHLLASASGVERTLHRPVKDLDGREAAIALDDEYGDTPATLEANGTIVWDPALERWVMFALAFASARPPADRARLYRLTSRDGIEWTRGEGGRPERIAFDLTDPETGARATGIDLFSCHLDPTDERHPYQGWLYNWGGPVEGLYHVRSPDGRRWERGRRVAPAKSRWLVQDGRVLQGPGDVTTFVPDPVSGRHLALLKFFAPRAVEHRNRLRSRAYAWVDRLDEPLDLDGVERIALVPPAADVNGDAPHDEYYAASAWRYGPQWLGGLKVWHHYGDYPHSRAGCAFLKLAASRDGIEWGKVPYADRDGVPEVWIANGEEGGNDGRADGGYVTEFSQGPLRIRRRARPLLRLLVARQEPLGGAAGDRGRDLPRAHAPGRLRECGRGPPGDAAARVPDGLPRAERERRRPGPRRGARLLTGAGGRRPARGRLGPPPRRPPAARR